MIRRPLLSALALMLILSGCEQRQTDESSLSAGAESISESATDLALDQLSKSLWHSQTDNFNAAIVEAESLQQRIDELITTADTEQLQAAQQQWHRAHNQLLRTSPLISFGSINPGLFQQIKAAISWIDNHPIQPGYLDYFDVYKHSGIVNDIAIPITAEAIRSQHGFSDNSDVSLGFHAMAYLLWGENGQRPASDFLTPETLTREQQLNGLKLVDLPNHRRATLLQLQAALLLDDLKALHYKFQHQASALNGAYLSLMPRSRIQLWQQSSLDVLNKIMAQPFMRQPETGGTHSDNSAPMGSGHNQFAREELQAIQATLHGMNQLLFSKEAEAPSLAQQLMKEKTPQLREDFDKALALLDTLIREKTSLNDSQPQLHQSIAALVHQLAGNQGR